jgi:pyroglutamyl-peptidase
MPSDQHAGRILVTGFGPFPGVLRNPTQQLALRLHGQHIRGVEVVAEAWPTTLAGLDYRRRSAVLWWQPDLVVHLGVHGTAQAIHLERTAHNAVDFRVADAAGHQPLPGLLLADGPGQWQTALPAQELAQTLVAAGLPAHVSDDPGRYLCNATYALSLADDHGPAALFVHVPMPGAKDTTGQPWTMARLAQGIDVVLRELALTLSR